MTPRYPWATYLHDWELNLLEVSVDSAAAAHVDRDRRRIDLTGSPGWTALTIRATVRTTETPGSAIPQLVSYLLVASPRTNLRFPTPLAAVDKRAFDGVVVLYREQLAGQVSMVAEIVAEVDGVQRQVARSAAWTVVIDAATSPTPPGAPPFDMVWADFMASSSPQMLREHPGAYSLMDVSLSPTLYLNSGIDGLQALLTSEGAKMEKRRLRDIIGTLIARDATAALFRAAAAEVVNSDEGPVAPQDRLHRQVCEAVAATMGQVAEVDELYERLHSAEQQGGSTRALLWMEVDAALDDVTGVSNAIGTAVGEVKYA
jgi:hypothetical protein